MKKFLAITFGLVMVCTLFTGCGGNSTSSSSETTSKASTTTSKSSETSKATESSKVTESSEEDMSMTDTDRDGLADDIESGADSIGGAVSSAVDSLT